MASGFGLNGGESLMRSCQALLIVQVPRDAFHSGKKYLLAMWSTQAQKTSQARRNVSQSSRTTTSAYITKKRYRTCPLDATRLPTHCVQIARTKILQAAYRKAEEEKAGKESIPKADEIRSLGLVKATHAELNLKHGNLLPTLKRN